MLAQIVIQEEWLGLIMLACLFGAIVVGFPIAQTLLVMSFGFGFIGFGTTAFNLFTNKTYEVMTDVTLAAVPLFLLMGYVLEQAGLMDRLFRALQLALANLKGSLYLAVIAAATIFAAATGIVGASVTLIGLMAIPSMTRSGYDTRLSAGAITAGGTLGILIPPSVILIIYSILTEQNIAKMFLSAFIPGVIAAVGYILAVALYVRLVPNAGAARERISWPERFSLFKDIWHVIIIFTVMIGGIYLGWFTPTEGAAVGAAGTGLIALFQRDFNLDALIEVIESTAVTSAMIFLVLLGAEFFNAFIALTQLPNTLAAFVVDNNFSPLVVVACILCLYLFLGCLMDSLAMILLTIPVFFPLVMTLDFGMSPEETAIWFGILTLIVVEVGLITPPVGLNVFIINKMAGDVPIADTFKGVIPFLASDLIRVILLFSFPSITLVLLRLFW